MRGGLDRGGERGGGVVAPHLGKAAERGGPAQAGVLLERDGVVGERGAGVGELALLGERCDTLGGLSARRTMFRQRPPLLRRGNNLLVRGDLARADEHVDRVLGLTYLDGLADELVGHRVDVAVDVDVALEIDNPLVEQIDLGPPRRQPTHGGPLDGVELVGAGRQAPSELRVDLVAPRTRLPVGVGEVGEPAAGEEVLLDEVKGPLDPRRAIRVALLVRDEGEAEPARERLHLGHRHHLLAGAVEHHDVGVVDHATLARAVVIADALVEELFALESSEPWIELEEQPTRVGQHERRGLRAAHRAADVHVVRRRVVLHLLARIEVIASGRLLGLVADAVLAAERRERRVAQREPVTLDELLVDAYEIAAALGVEREDGVAVRLSFLRAYQRRRRDLAVAQHAFDRAARDLERVGDRARAVAGLMKSQDGLSGGLVQHASPRGWRRATRTRPALCARRGCVRR